MKINKEGFVTASVTIIILTIIILIISYFFATQKWIIGHILIALGIITLIPLSIFRIPIQILKADILFGMIDNGLLAIFALIGAELFGILGAIVGGVVGNAITDGLAGIFEGYGWQKITKLKIKDKRTALTVAIGKLTGCLLGAGVVLTIAWSILNLA